MNRDKILSSATHRMRSVFLFHVALMVAVMSIAPVFPVTAHLVNLGNVVNFVPFYLYFFALTIGMFQMLMAERFWDVQRITLVFWPLATQGVFVFSRFVCVTVMVCVSAMIVGALVR